MLYPRVEVMPPVVPYRRSVVTNELGGVDCDPTSDNCCCQFLRARPECLNASGHLMAKHEGVRHPVRSGHAVPPVTKIRAADTAPFHSDQRFSFLQRRGGNLLDPKVSGTMDNLRLS